LYCLLQASHKRKLAQDTLEATPNGDNPFTGIANAFRFIFSNTFDWARANGERLRLYIVRATVCIVYPTVAHCHQYSPMHDMIASW
jgi:hypothetical protein